MFESRVKSKLRILDFDIEVRPLSWYGGDFVTKEVTAIAAKFIGERKTFCWLLGEDEPTTILEGFVALYDAADVVTGHYIRGFDLPTINGALFEFGLQPLSSKLSHDTKLDLVKRQGLSSSQENLASTLGIRHPKVGMNQDKWRQANRLTPEGIALTRKRVIGDVRQHIEMRQRLLDAGMLRPPRLWSNGSQAAEYTP